MTLRSAIQPSDEHVAHFEIPEGLLEGTAGAVVVLRFPTPREALDLREAEYPSNADAEMAFMSMMLIAIRSAEGGEEMLAADIDLEKLPLPIWTFINRCVSAVLEHGVVKSGEALRAWRAAQSTEESSDQTSSTSSTSSTPKPST